MVLLFESGDSVEGFEPTILRVGHRAFDFLVGKLANAHAES